MVLRLSTFLARLAFGRSRASKRPAETSRDRLERLTLDLPMLDVQHPTASTALYHPIHSPPPLSVHVAT
jgi:hypothetical protein